MCFYSDVFFCCWKGLMKLDVNNFLRFFQFLTLEAVFLASGKGVFLKSFIVTSVYKFWVNSKPSAFIQTIFFCCWKALLKLGVNQFSLIFSVSNSGSRVFTNSSWRQRYTDFGFFQIERFYSDVFLLLLESITEIRC